MPVNGYSVFDGDGHVLESDEELSQYFEGDFEGGQCMTGLSIFPSLDGWSRGPMLKAEDTNRKYWHTDAQVWSECLEMIGAEGTVLYPTAALAHGLMRDVDFASAAATAYNNWLEDRYTSKDTRLFGAGCTPIQDPIAGAKEIIRCANDRQGIVAMTLPTVTNTGKTYGDKFFWPIFEEAERQNMPLALHGAPSEGFGFDHFTQYISSHTLEHPAPLFIQITDMMFSGVFDAFPKLRFAFLEAGCSWIPFMMDRMDYEFDSIHGSKHRKTMCKRPSDYFRDNDQLWFAMELGESSLKYVIDMIGSERIIYASDYPHEPSTEDLTSELPEFLENPDISDQAKQNIVYNNSRNLYRIDEKSVGKTGD
ncbi:MAG: amidohydrolase family protein [Pseudomonadota bacterium]|nr:amidohydrolase family protein [Pseudomonadota bacterium]